MGMEVAPRKSEAMFLHRGGTPPPSSIRVAGHLVPVGSRLKYLGLTLDGRWSFERHFEDLAPRLERASMALSRMLPNLRGPSGRVRRLLVGAVRSIALYGAPIWAADLTNSPKAMRICRASERRLAARVVRAYRTVSHRAALVLAGIPPLALAAAGYAESYRRLRRLRERGVAVTARAREVLRWQTRRSVLGSWQNQLLTDGPGNTSGRRVVGALGPRLSEWVDRGWGELSFRTTQVLAGHGCFGEYLCRIGKESGPRCHHCVADVDSADHTVMRCPAWSEFRRVLVRDIGEDLSLSGVVGAMLESERKWRAVASFSERVMLRKEAAERERRGEGPRQQRPLPHR
ncbi:uncharacterized protein LOC113563522 [Ooceraea biroi]|uniref:uncharacterized protein LOC113563488 n=1 Tax=Ooceraea biroi TaxID=2015173 RepID=UPI000F0774D6|nr:uncharacterized protein LOC113563488 [Ooceraea biroi]XP_026830982.1 uncharacterized protein LOC113563522 [Ooceraea biroi]